MADSEVRKGFIAALLGVSPEKVTKTVLLPTHLRQEYGEARLGILDFKLFTDDKEYYSRFHLWEDNRKRMYTDKMEIHILELPKLSEKQYPENELLDWARFINTEKREEFKHMAEKNEYLGKAYDKLNYISADEEKRLEYEAREKAIRDHNYLMKENWEEGFHQGEQIGEQRLMQLIAKMLENNEYARISNLINNPEFLNEMYKKYNL